MRALGKVSYNTGTTQEKMKSILTVGLSPRLSNETFPPHHLMWSTIPEEETNEIKDRYYDVKKESSPEASSRERIAKRTTITLNTEAIADAIASVENVNLDRPFKMDYRFCDTNDSSADSLTPRIGASGFLFIGNQRKSVTPDLFSQIQTWTRDPRNVKVVWDVKVWKNAVYEKRNLSMGRGGWFVDGRARGNSGGIQNDSALEHVPTTNVRLHLKDYGPNGTGKPVSYTHLTLPTSV